MWHSVWYTVVCSNVKFTESDHPQRMTWCFLSFQPHQSEECWRSYSIYFLSILYLFLSAVLCAYINPKVSFLLSVTVSSTVPCSTGLGWLVTKFWTTSTPLPSSSLWITTTYFFQIREVWLFHINLQTSCKLLPYVSLHRKILRPSEKADLVIL